MLPFPSYHQDQRRIDQLHSSCRDVPPHTTYNMKFMDVTEPKREFDKYPQVKLLILAERVLVMANPLQQGHGVKTQH